MEIIEIGAVMQSSRTFAIESEFQTFVRPVRRPVLTDFCTELTGITQHDLTDALPFRQAMESDEAVDGRTFADAAVLLVGRLRPGISFIKTVSITGSVTRFTRGT